MLLLEAKGESPSIPSSAAPPGTGQPASLADALASALNKGKTKLQEVMTMMMMMTGDPIIG